MKIKNKNLNSVTGKLNVHATFLRAKLIWPENKNTQIYKCTCASMERKSKIANTKQASLLKMV